jgi:hypothetical protein
MGENKGKAKPVDGTKWLEAFREEKPWGLPDQWRLDDLFLIKMRLHTFFTCSERNQIPSKILQWIEEERKRIPEGCYSTRLKREMRQELDALEIRLYQYLLPPEEYGVITQQFPKCTSKEDLKQSLITTFIEKLRESLTTLPDRTKILATPIGKNFSAGSMKTDGETRKSSALMGAYILKMYELFKPFYSVSGRGWSNHRAKTAGGQFPMALIKDIVEFFQTEFSPWFDDLTVRDVISRIQYGRKRKVQEIMPSPPNEGIRPIRVMKVTISPATSENLKTEN